MTQSFTSPPDLRSTVLPLEAGDWRISVRECTDRGCGSPTPQVTVQSNGAIQFDPDDLLQDDLPTLQQFNPVGVFATPDGRRARRGRRFPLQLRWGVWRNWRSWASCACA